MISVSAEVEVTTDKPEDIDEVYSELRGVPGIDVTPMPAPAAPGEQGAALDVLMVTLSSGAATAFLQIIKVLAESHGPKFSLKIRQGKNKLEVTADNVDEILPVIKALIDGRRSPR
jgi:Effector Associated Constant Component 1